MQDTIDAVVNSSFWPLSILMESCYLCVLPQVLLILPQVGVGTASFAVMQDIFDTDTEPLLSSAGQTACRDNVQFVSLRDYSDQHSVLCRLCEEVLRLMLLLHVLPGLIRRRKKIILDVCRDVLAEIPRQAAAYLAFMDGKSAHAVNDEHL